MGVIGSSRKENEHRRPLHPDHLDGIPGELRPQVRFEQGYGEPFGVDDSELQRGFGGVAGRGALMAESDVVLLPKPLPDDLREMREGAVLWGWPHCVQQPEITQVAIDRRLTLIAWEAMFTWKRGVRDLHVFARNNEMAGYCAVIHALGLTGQDGLYGPYARACVLSHGSVSRGAIYALLGRGFDGIEVFTQRPSWAVHDMIPGCRYGQMTRDEDGKPSAKRDDGTRLPLREVLAGADVIVNGILQDTDDPLMFLEEGDERRLRPGSLIVDVSCDLGMGFPFARPTSFERPTFPAGRATYYAVDHSPTYLWRSASWEISRALIPFLPAVLEGKAGWESEETIRRSIEIREGVIQNEKIVTFQNRAPDYPHLVRNP